MDHSPEELCPSLSTFPFDPEFSPPLLQGVKQFPWQRVRLPVVYCGDCLLFLLLVFLLPNHLDV